MGSFQGLKFQDKVLEDLIASRADVDIPIGKGGAVVEQKHLSITTRFNNAIIQACLLPGLQALRFAFYQIGLHRKAGLRKIQCVFIVHYLEFSKATKVTILPVGVNELHTLIAGACNTEGK